MTNNNVIELTCKVCNINKHTYASVKSFEKSKARGGYICPPCVGRSDDAIEKKKRWREDNIDFLRKEGIKSIGIDEEQYYHVLKVREEAKKEIKEINRQNREKRKIEKQALKDKIKKEHFDKLNASFDGEVWKDINYYGFDRYEASTMGRIRNKKTLRIFTPQIQPTGYANISLKNVKGKIETLLIHRIIAKTFLENTENKPCVSHINTIRNDNRVCNLEWV